ncbi:SLC13 family permease [Aerococcus urinaeequi]|uniref:SLC13 family permease n=1 Tax=Aerococcus urinaeequi TaxID=51665 RepID=UPI003AB01707
MTYMLLIIGAIILAIFLGEKFDVNAGIVGVVFAYILGSFMIGLSPDEIFALWPVELFMMIFGVSFFFNFANENGTLEIIGHHLIYAFRNHLFWLPFGFFFAAALISGLGGSIWGSVPIVGFLALNIAKENNLDTRIVAIAVIEGALAGGIFPFGPLGAIVQGLMASTGFANMAQEISWQLFIVSAIYPILLLLFLMFRDRKNDAYKQVELKAPEALNPKQKQTLTLMTIFIGIMLIFPIIDNFTGGSIPFIASISVSLNLGLMGIVFGVIAYMFELADGQKVLNRTPWSVIWMTCGISLLIGVGVQVGITESLAALISYVPWPIIPVTIALLCGCMSIFSSTIGVIAPLFFTTLPALYATTGWSPAIMAVCIIIGGFAATVTPFSDGGSLLLASSGYLGKDQKDLYNTLLFRVTPFTVGSAAITALTLSIIHSI